MLLTMKSSWLLHVRMSLHKKDLTHMRSAWGSCVGASACVQIHCARACRCGCTQHLHAAVHQRTRICTQVGPHIVVFKTHVDIFDKWDDSIVARLQEVAKKHGKHHRAHCCLLHVNLIACVVQL